MVRSPPRARAASRGLRPDRTARPAPRRPVRPERVARVGGERDAAPRALGAAQARQRAQRGRRRRPRAPGRPPTRYQAGERGRQRRRRRPIAGLADQRGRELAHRGGLVFARERLEQHVRVRADPCSGPAPPAPRGGPRRRRARRPAPADRRRRAAQVAQRLDLGAAHERPRLLLRGGDQRRRRRPPRGCLPRRERRGLAHARIGVGQRRAQGRARASRPPAGPASSRVAR